MYFWPRNPGAGLLNIFISIWFIFRNVHICVPYYLCILLCNRAPWKNSVNEWFLPCIIPPPPPHPPPFSNFPIHLRHPNFKSWIRPWHSLVVTMGGNISEYENHCCLKLINNFIDEYGMGNATCRIVPLWFCSSVEPNARYDTKFECICYNIQNNSACLELNIRQATIHYLKRLQT